MNAPLTSQLMAIFAWPLARLTRRPLRLFSTSWFQSEWMSHRLGGRQLVVANAEEQILHVLTRRADNYPKGRLLQVLLGPLIGDGLFAAADDPAAVRRTFIRAIARVDGRTVAEISERLLAKAIDRWIRAEAIEHVPIVSEMSRLAVDIVSECLFHKRFGEEDSMRFTTLFTRYQGTTRPLRLLPWNGHPAFAPVLNFRRRRIASAMRTLIARRFVDALRDPASPVAQSPFARALAEREIGGQPILTRERLIDETAVMLLAGHETSAATLAWLCILLSGDPDLQERIRSAGANSPLLEATLNEVLRLYPPIAFYVRDAQDNDSVAGNSVEAGSLVLVSPWIIQRHERNWGSDAKTFRPERFLEEGAADSSSRFMPFGLGPRACPGARFAMAELRAVASSLLRRFELRCTTERAIEPLGNLTTRPMREFRIVLVPVSPEDRAA